MISAIVVDDEQPSLNKLEKLINSSNLAAVEEKFTEPLKALDYLRANKVDAVFLDIEMPNMDGIELAGHILDLQSNIDVVFVTAYNQYAVEAFRLNALDYLMKPVSADRLKETLHRINGRKDFVPCGELSVRCFGRFSVSAGTKEVKFRTEKAEELLAYLIDCRGDFVSRSKMIDSLWEDFEGDRAITHFNTTLHYVKKALLQYGIRISVQYDRGSYRLDTEGLDCDYLKFCSFAEKRETATLEMIELYEETANLYTGEYLSGWEYDWTTGKRLMLESQRIRLLLAIASCYKEAGNYQKAAQWLEAGLLREPLHREMNYKLIEILLLTNERVLATKYYDVYRNGLMKKFKMEPDCDFQKLV